MRSYTLYDAMTDLRAEILIYSPAPGTAGFTLQYQIHGPFVDLDTRQTIMGFPTEQAAYQHACELAWWHNERVRASKLFEPGSRKITKMLRFVRGDIEAEAEMWWGGDDGWQWDVTWWWPGGKLNVRAQLERLDPVAAYLEMRARFLEVVTQMGGFAYEIETLETPFGAGELPPPVPDGLTPPPDRPTREALREQLAAELAEFRAKHPDDSTNKEHTDGADSPVAAGTDPGNIPDAEC